MNFDELQKEWREQDSQGQVVVDQEALLKLVQRNQRNFERTIFDRDFREIAVALALVPYWIWSGIKGDLPWTWYLVIPGVLWVAGYLFFDRRAQKVKQPKSESTLRASAVHALAQINHQIQLLKNVFWWYLFPISLPMLIFFVHVAWMAGDWWGLANKILFVGLLYWGVYELNQRAVRKDLTPRAKELHEFLDSLDQPQADAATVESDDNNPPI